MTGSAPFMQSSIRRMVASHSPGGRRLKSLASRTNFSVNFPVARNQQPIASAASNRNGVASDAAKKRKTLSTSSAVSAKPSLVWSIRCRIIPEKPFWIILSGPIAAILNADESQLH
jgi:hypothetical protein